LIKVEGKKKVFLTLCVFCFLSVCRSVCLSVCLRDNELMLVELFWIGVAWPKEQSIRCCWWSGSASQSGLRTFFRIIYFHLPLLGYGSLGASPPENVWKYRCIFGVKWIKCTTYPMFHLKYNLDFDRWVSWRQVVKSGIAFPCCHFESITEFTVFVIYVSQPLVCVYWLHGAEFSCGASHILSGPIKGATHVQSGTINTKSLCHSHIKCWPTFDIPPCGYFAVNL